jgi:Helix-turn-helix domain
MAETIPLAWIELFPDREDLSIMSRLARHANRLGICWPSQETIAKAIGVSRSTVCRRIGSILAAFPNTLQRIEHEGKNAYFLPELAHKEKNLESDSLSHPRGEDMCK